MGVLEETREALAGCTAWLVGGALRDRLMGRVGEDLDLVVEGDVERAARTLARTLRGACFALSDEFGAWRVVRHAGGGQVDLNPLRAASLAGDLALRDFTVNAIAQPLGGGELIDPLGGAEDLRRGVLRPCGPEAFRDDPLRTLRLVRFASELGLEVAAESVRLARASAPALAGVAAERVFAELARILVSPRPDDGMRLAGELGLLATVLPEVQALDGVEQSRFHHLDVWGHTLEVLAEARALGEDPGARLGADHAPAVRALLDEPLADGLTRGGALRFGALLHDVAKPLTRAVRDDGRVIFPGHDERGTELSREILTRLRSSERLRSHVAALTRQHLRLGFLVHERPLSARAEFAYLRACGPVAADVTLLSVADRLATRGAKAEPAIERHLELAREILPAALRWHAEGPVGAPVRGDVLARSIGLAPGPELGALLEELAAARYAGELSTAQEAIEHARLQRARG
ncbi:MAG TPA: HD domain-containing protein [Solirubrobacteraceae bacterium]|nr:HD domain-containing protein [Solirubrobacteraceae bacterium]